MSLHIFSMCFSQRISFMLQCFLHISNSIGSAFLLLSFCQVAGVAVSQGAEPKERSGWDRLGHETRSLTDANIICVDMC